MAAPAPRPSPPDVVVVGDVMVDVAVDARALATGGGALGAAPGPLAHGGDVRGRVRLRPGGAGANAAAWAAAAGARVVLHARVGDDLAGRLLGQALAERGVRALLGVDPALATGTMLVVREPGERSMVADRGANAALAPDDLPEAMEAGAVLVSGYALFDPASEPAAAAALGRARAPVVAVEAASWPLLEAYGPERFLAATAAATLLLANEAEARTLTGEAPDRAARRLAARYGAACVKLGPRGAILVLGGEALRAEAPAVAEADPTGAGDAFDGTLLAALASGAKPDAALAAACQAGARAAASLEAWPPVPARPKVAAR